MNEIHTSSTDPGETQERPVITLRVIGGPEMGLEMPLLGSDVVLGRSSNADLTLSDNMLSRAHAKLIFSNAGWEIVDEGSTNGTWVRGERINHKIQLPMRTPVRIGQTVFELVGNDSEMDELDERLISYREQAMSPDNLAVRTTPEYELGGKRDRQNRQLAAVYKFQSLLTGDLSEHELYDRILELITETVHADNAYLLSWSEEEHSMIPVAERNSYGPVELVADEYLSTSIINYVREKNEAILSVDAKNDERFDGESLTGIEVRSVMCVPMHGQRSLIGLIYVISTKPERKYREHELRLLNVVAYSAGMAIENRRLLENSLKSERMAAIGKTAAGLSHYVKNILNGLEGSVSLMRMGIDGQDRKVMDQAWEILNKNHKRLSTLMLDLLNLAKEDKIDTGVYNLAEIIIEAVDLVRPQCQAENITIEIDPVLRKNAIQGEFDSRGIHRVILNLLNNAIDAVRQRHGSSGDGRISITAGHDVQRQVIEILVRDNGAGIPKDQIGNIFDSFQSLKGDQGTGLGLAVSKRIVERHKGKIEFESKLSEGSVFRVILPASQAVDITQTIKVLDVNTLDLGNTFP